MVACVTYVHYHQAGSQLPQRLHEVLVSNTFWVWLEVQWTMVQEWDEILQIKLDDVIESGAGALGYQNMGCREGIVHLGKKTTPTLNRILERK
ncbi:unnamed protein product [Prunus armeniaca]|uniref:Uncharacterized protein n=1 Tax=Prunus armeniaca TaxID=36596 RepID=A0A6J5TYA3_PRUAR|nr:unnamed protein product [Prunus armeniaca]